MRKVIRRAKGSSARDAMARCASAAAPDRADARRGGGGADGYGGHGWMASALAESKERMRMVQVGYFYWLKSDNLIGDI